MKQEATDVHLWDVVTINIKTHEQRIMDTRKTAANAEAYIMMAIARRGVEIDRGLSYVCGGEPYGGDRGCGLYFCEKHMFSHERLPQLCKACSGRHASYKAKPDIAMWITFKLIDNSWKKWRDENPDEVAKMKQALSPTT